MESTPAPTGAQALTPGEMLRALHPDPGSLPPLTYRTVEAIFFTDEVLTFRTTTGHLVSWRVDGDCCSRSYFHDFFGVDVLLGGGMVTDMAPVSLAPGDPGYRAQTWEAPEGDEYNVIQVYGYRLTVEDERWGERSAVFSFRNSSNGYYGGTMEPTEAHVTDEAFRLTQDRLGD